MVEEVEDEDALTCCPDMCAHKTNPQNSKIMEIIEKFVYIQEDGFLGYDPELDDEDDDNDSDLLIEI
jgi:hypothetical protein